MKSFTGNIFAALLLFSPIGYTSNHSGAQLLVDAARERTRHQVTYSGNYQKLNYPMGDVPDNLGVCTDVIIRSYRKLGLDLQQLVHEDMSASFNDYPKNWGLKGPDSNIDHRRVPNLQTFLTRKGASLAISSNINDYLPGDLVTWMLPGNLPHIGVVSDHKSADGKRYLIIHNIGFGPKEEDFLFAARITGHYRYFPE
ncbi:DUF1287 domain-containing protein [Aliikangiella sp. G2MR2-5]|uniref:DUF1287 domain-containing protein n=1 Tax=Aliikangiella sp. G2MR2-5 TaxID=2788943 RepID=UPI0018A939AB|nr:DUF1287 domain-containing protein [Aliikangiella sp. G2MR2-5]